MNTLEICKTSSRFVSLSGIEHWLEWEGDGGYSHAVAPLLNLVFVTGDLDEGVRDKAGTEAIHGPQIVSRLS
jgi:hypothetical protein